MERDRMKQILSEAIAVLCKASLTFTSDLTVEGLLGITLDKKEIILVNINEEIQKQAEIHRRQCSGKSEASVKKKFQPSTSPSSAMSPQSQGEVHEFEMEEDLEIQEDQENKSVTTSQHKGQKNISLSPPGLEVVSIKEEKEDLSEYGYGYPKSPSSSMCASQPGCSLWDSSPTQSVHLASEIKPNLGAGYLGHGSSSDGREVLPDTTSNLSHLANMALLTPPGGLTQNYKECPALQQSLTSEDVLQMRLACRNLYNRFYSSDQACAMKPKEWVENAVRSQVEVTSQVGVLTCQFCGRSFDAMRKLKRHIIIHSSVRYRCRSCPKSFTHPEYLSQHVKVVHAAAKKHRCPYCNRIMSTRQRMKLHSEKCPYKPMDLVQKRQLGLPAGNGTGGIHRTCDRTSENGPAAEEAGERIDKHHLVQGESHDQTGPDD